MALSVGRVFGLLELQDQFSSRLQHAAAELSTFESRVARFNTNALAKQLDSAGMSAMRAGTTLSAAITLPLVGLGAAALKSGTEFEGAMNRVLAATDAPADEMAKLRAAAMKMGADTTFSATEAAQAMVELGKAGFDSSQTIGALPAVLQLATAGQMELADAASLTSNTMKTFGLGIEGLAKANDTLAKAANLSTIDVRDLAEGFKYVGPVAAAANVSLETVSASMALLGEAGIKGSMAGTTLRNMMTTLMSPTDKQAGLMKELGLQSAYANGKLMDLPDILRILEGQGNKTAEIMELFGDRAGPGMVALVEKGGSALSKLRTDLDDTGYAARNAEKLMRGLPGALEQLRGSVETAFIALSKSMEPAFVRAAEAGKKLADFIANTVVPAFDKLSPTTKLAMGAIVALAAAAGPLLLVLGAMATGLSTILPLWTAARVAAFAFGNTVPVLTARLWLMDAAQKAVNISTALFGKTAGAAFLGVGGTVAAVGGAIAGIALGVYKVVGAVQDLIKHLREGKSLMEFFTRQDKDNWLRRGLNMDTGKGVQAPPKQGGGDVMLPAPPKIVVPPMAAAAGGGGGLKLTKEEISAQKEAAREFASMAGEMVDRVKKADDASYKLKFTMWGLENQLKDTIAAGRENQWELITRAMNKATDGAFDFDQAVRAAGVSIREGLNGVNLGSLGFQEIDLSDLQVKIPPSTWERVFGSSSKDMGAAIATSIQQAITGGGDVFGAVAGTLGQALTSNLANMLTRTTDAAGKAIAPALSGWLGGAVSAVLPGIGSLLAPLATKAFQWIGGMFGGEGRKVNDLRDTFMAQFGGSGTGEGSGFNTLAGKMAEIGEAGRAMFQRLIGASKESDFRSAVEEITAALEKQKNKQAEVADAAEKTNSKVSEAQQAAIDKVKSRLSDLDNTYNQLWKSIENEAPEDEMGIIERNTRARMDAVGRERAQTQSELEKLTAAMEASFDGVTDAVDRLVDAIGSIPTSFGNGNTGIRTPDVNPDIGVDPGGTSGGPGGSTQGGGDVYIDGRKAGRVLAPHVVAEMQLQGV